MRTPLAKCEAAEAAALRSFEGTSELARRLDVAGDSDDSGVSERLSDDTSLAGETQLSSSGIETILRKYVDEARSVLGLATRAGENAADVLAQCVATEAAASRRLNTGSELARRLGVADDSAS